MNDKNQQLLKFAYHLFQKGGNAFNNVKREFKELFGISSVLNKVYEFNFNGKNYYSTNPNILNVKNEKDLFEILENNVNYFNIGLNNINNLQKFIDNAKRNKNDIDFKPKLKYENLINDIIFLYEKNYSQNDIAKTLKISQKTVSNYLKKLREEGKI